MSTDDLQPNQQEAMNHSPLRQRLLHEIADVLPPHAQATTPDMAEAEEVECGNVHPFRDLNITTFARQVDALFLHRWLEGYGSSKKTQGQSALDKTDGCSLAKHL